MDFWTGMLTNLHVVVDMHMDILLTNFFILHLLVKLLSIKYERSYSGSMHQYHMYV